MSLTYSEPTIREISHIAIFQFFFLQTVHMSLFVLWFIPHNTIAFWNTYYTN